MRHVCQTAQPDLVQHIRFKHKAHKERKTTKRTKSAVTSCQEALPGIFRVITSRNESIQVNARYLVFESRIASRELAMTYVTPIDIRQRFPRITPLLCGLCGVLFLSVLCGKISDNSPHPVRPLSRDESLCVHYNGTDYNRRPNGGSIDTSRAEYVI